MAEVSRDMAQAAQLRVAVLASEPARASALVARVAELGHLVSDADDANVVLVDGGTDLTLSGLPAVVLGGTDAEAAGILEADADALQIDAALRAVAAGLSVRPYTRTEPSFAALEEPETAALLTPREIEVLVALSEGLSNKGVARRLDISQHTVKFHVESIFRKLGVATRAEAVAKGLRHGLVLL